MKHTTHNLQFSSKEKNLKGFQEVIFSVADLDKWIDFFKRICEWEIIYCGKGTTALKKIWHLEDTTEIDEVVLRNPGDSEGHVRLVKFKNIEQQQIRSAASVWDTGGIFDINMRTPDMDAFYRELQDEGWNGYANPYRYTFAEYDVSEVLMKGPDGVTIAFMQRYSPALVGFDHMKKTSRIFNSSVTVRDMEASRKFYVDQLGFEMFFQTPGTNRKGGVNVVGIPPSINQDVTLPIDIVRPDIDGTGSIEYLKTNELEGTDHTSLAKPPNLGILMYRFPVRDVTAYAKSLQAKGLKLNSEVLTLDILPYGEIKTCSVVSPDGVWIEFIELIS